MTEIIYFQNKALYITDTITPQLDEFLHLKKTMFIDEFNIHTVRTMIHEMDQEEIYRGVFLHKDVPAVLEAFKKQFIVIQAGGGIVSAPPDHLLMIFRKGKWDLPKGKLDPGEDLAACAIREVKEETGITSLTMDRFYGITYHTYHEKGNAILKESHWYLMHAPQQEKLQAQTEEDIESCQWVAKKNVPGYLDHAHASIASILRQYLGT